MKTRRVPDTKGEAQARWDSVTHARNEKQDKFGAFTDASRDGVLARRRLRALLPQAVHRTVCRALRGPARIAARALDPDHPGGAGEPRDQAPRRRHRDLSARQRIIGPGATVSVTVCALMLETNDEGAVARRCMALATFARVTGTFTLRLPAVAT